MSEGGAIPPPPSGPSIRWELLRRDGSAVESGVLGDPRWFFFDSVDEKGRLHGGFMKGDSGLLILNVPAVKGVLRVSEMEGEEIGRVEFDPGRWKFGDG
jgi:hypothetical protein